MKLKTMLTIALILTASITLAQETHFIVEDSKIELVRVKDGDTIVVNIHLGFDIVLKNQAIRIDGYDSPEVKGRGKEETIKQYRERRKRADAATEALANRLSEGKKISYRFTGKKSFNRWIAKITVDGLEMSKYMAVNGHIK